MYFAQHFILLVHLEGKNIFQGLLLIATFMKHKAVVYRVIEIYVCLVKAALGPL